MSPSTSPSLNDILIVDDAPANLSLLAGMLKKSGFRVRPVPSGRLALSAAEHLPPDLVLLDINMPEMDGFEVCRRFKENDALRDIPIIFLSALTEPLDKVTAFQMGAVDFISKPFHIEEVLSRVRTHLKIRGLQLALATRNREVETAYGQLKQLEKARDDLIHMLVHDLRAPLQGILGFLSLLKQDAPKLDPKHLEYIQHCLSGSERLLGMINDLLDLNRLESGKMPIHPHPVSPLDLLQQALNSLQGRTLNHTLRIDTSGAPMEIAVDPVLIRRVLENLVGNAVKFSPRDSTIGITIRSTPSETQFEVSDEGIGIPAEFQASIFDKFAQLQHPIEGYSGSTGLGLAICRLIVEAHGGRIGVQSTPDHGSTFHFTIPSRHPDVSQDAQP
ncbi:MAG TPA: response regulator [Candidatus Ozemobacteraceae bacterium]